MRKTTQIITLVTYIAVIFLSSQGCAKRASSSGGISQVPKLASLYIGMPRHELLASWGNPAKTFRSIREGEEYENYRYWIGSNSAGPGSLVNITLINGRVTNWSTFQ